VIFDSLRARPSSLNVNFSQTQTHTKRAYQQQRHKKAVARHTAELQTPKTKEASAQREIKFGDMGSHSEKGGTIYLGHSKRNMIIDLSKSEGKVFRKGLTGKTKYLGFAIDPIYKIYSAWMGKEHDCKCKPQGNML
jgi:hypothetical protein